MSSKAIGVKLRKKLVAKVVHGPILRSNIRAGQATAAPPLGPQIGQRGINVGNFCKEFNKQTEHILPGVWLGCPDVQLFVDEQFTFSPGVNLFFSNSNIFNPMHGTLLPTRITVKPDRSFSLEINTPITSWLIKRAAGIRRGASKIIPNEVVGQLSIKHVYEIAKVKSADSSLVGVPMDVIVRKVIAISRGMGVKVVPNLEEDTLRVFLQDRHVQVEKQLKELQDKKAAKMLRTV